MLYWVRLGYRVNRYYCNHTVVLLITLQRKRKWSILDDILPVRPSSPFSCQSETSLEHQLKSLLSIFFWSLVQTTEAPHSTRILKKMHNACTMLLLRWYIFFNINIKTVADQQQHELGTPNEGINQRNLKIWADWP